MERGALLLLEFSVQYITRRNLASNLSVWTIGFVSWTIGFVSVIVGQSKFELYDMNER